MNTGHPSPEEVFHKARAIESRSKREGYLDGACGDDAATILDRNVDALLNLEGVPFFVRGYGL